MKSYNEIKEELLHHYKEVLEEQQKNLDNATNNNDLHTINTTRKRIDSIKKSIENLDEATKSCIGNRVNYLLNNIEHMSQVMQNDYFDHFDRFSDIFLGNTLDENGKRYSFGNDLGLTKDDLSLFKGKIVSLTTTKDDFINYANQQFGTNIPTCEDMILMEQYRNSQNRDEYVRYAEMCRDSGKLSDPGYVIDNTVQDLLDYFDSKYKEQISNKQM